MKTISLKDEVFFETTIVKHPACKGIVYRTSAYLKLSSDTHEKAVKRLYKNFDEFQRSERESLLEAMKRTLRS